MSYKNALCHYRCFHATYHAATPLLPVSVEQLTQFIVVCTHRQLQPATITSYLSAIAYVHRVLNLVSPTDSFIVKKLLHGLRRSSNFDKRLPFTVPQLIQLTNALTQFTHSTFSYVLFKAMFLLAFFGLFRVGEIASTRHGAPNIIQRKDVFLRTNLPGKLSHIDIKLHSYKHSQGHSTLVPVKRQHPKAVCPVRALVRYLRLSPHSSRSLFCDISGNPVSAASFRAILRKCIIHCNLDPSLYTAHSFRIGGATHAHSVNFSPTDIQRLGRWRSSAYLKYIRPSPVGI